MNASVSWTWSYSMFRCMAWVTPWLIWASDRSKFVWSKLILLAIDATAERVHGGLLGRIWRSSRSFHQGPPWAHDRGEARPRPARCLAEQIDSIFAKTRPAQHLVEQVGFGQGRALCFAWVKLFFGFWVWWGLPSPLDRVLYALLYSFLQTDLSFLPS